jgi:hypothetical protein
MGLPANSHLARLRALRPPEAPAAGQAAVMLTHRDTPRLQEHFRRFRREVAPLMPAFLLLHRTEGTEGSADIVLTDADLERGTPRRYREMRASGKRVNLSFVDIAVMPAFNSELLRSYQYVWLVEYDVDYAGNWADALRPHVDRTADLLGTRILTPEHHPHWYNWRSLVMPPDYREEDKLSAFIPLARLSRRLIDVFGWEMSRDGWAGHTEALIPTVARHHGLAIEDFAEAPAFKERGTLPLDDNTFGAKPVRSTRYFHEAPWAFARHDILWHPVKPGF